MMRVEWLQSALDELTDLWTKADSSSRRKITSASNMLELRLQHDPWNEGESRSNGRRFTPISPLADVFRIEPDGLTVTVLQVRFVRRRRP